MIEFAGIKINLYYILIISLIGHLIFDVFKFQMSSMKKNVLILFIATLISVGMIAVNYFILGHSIQQIVIDSQSNFLCYLIAVGFYSAFSKYMVRTIEENYGKSKKDIIDNQANNIPK